MNCKNCNQPISKENKFCESCAAPNEILVKVAPVKGWTRIKYILTFLVLAVLSFSLIYGLVLEDNPENFTGWLIAIILGLWSFAFLLRAFNKTISGVMLRFFELKPVKNGVGILKVLIKFSLWLGLVGLAIWLIVALGPLWIIAIILLLILLVVLNK